MVSALYTNYGVYKSDERKQQTLETIKSIKKYIPNPIIVMMENSTTAIQNDNSDDLNEIIDQVDYFFDNSDDSDIQYFHKNVSNYDIGKNMMECIGTFKVFNHISEDPELLELVKTADRFFKISGRYLITEKFNIKDFTGKGTEGKYLFRKATTAWIPEQDTGVNTLLQTRFFAFGPELFEEFKSIYKSIMENMFNLVNQGKYIDLEHSMSKFIPKDKLVELDQVGVKGNIAPNGAGVED